MAVDKQYWIFSPLQDTTLVMFTPVLILLAFAAAQYGAWMDGLLAFALVLAMGHYLPGMLRAYGDRALFRRFRTRLIAAPLFIVTATTLFAYRNLHAVLLLTTIWGMWHWMMQSYGFARIYDAKSDSSARMPGWLDQAICLLWFGMAAFVLHNDLPSYVTNYYESGGAYIPASVFVWFTRAWVAVTTAATAYYVVQIAKAMRQGHKPNPLKFIFIIVTFAYLTYTNSVVQRPKMGLLMFEAWHDVQYLAIVWFFNLSRTRKNPEAGSFIRFFFRPSALMAAAYVALCLVFGMLTHAWSLFHNDIIVRIVASIVTSAALLHYYLDGFIWKIRETGTGEALGVRTATEPAQWVSLTPAWGWQALLWPLFIVPAVILGAVESRGAVPPMQVYEDVYDAFPNSPLANYQIARQLQEEGQLREAKVHYEKALALGPDMLPAHIFLGVLLADQQDPAAARPHFERALKTDPRNSEVHNDLGIVLDELGDLPGAKFHLERAVALDTRYSLAEDNLGMVLAKMGDFAGARIHQERAVQIDPQFADAQYQLGSTMAKLGDLDGAVKHFQEALRLDPEQHLAHNSLGEVLIKQGRIPEAKTEFEQALKIRPHYAVAEQNLASIQ
ncbi:MAG TPA: tetratricopeptide repeat protein [Terriglobia bacterium]|jgi:Tfp pilus assembly protein PilF